MSAIRTELLNRGADINEAPGRDRTASESQRWVAAFCELFAVSRRRKSR